MCVCVQEILEMVAGSLEWCNNVCISTAMVKLGKLRMPNEDYGRVTQHRTFTELLERICELSWSVETKEASLVSS